MYYPVGWPRILRLPPDNDPEIAEVEIKEVVCNRDKILSAILTANSLQIWYIKPCVPIISHRRPAESVAEIGENVQVLWRPDSSMIGVVTAKSHLIIYHIVVPTDVKTLYEQIDPPSKNLRRESDELFMKELIPPLIFSLAFEVEIEGGISDLVAIREELMIATKSGRILRYGWDGQEIRDYSLDLRRIPFCVDQQVLKAVPLTDKGAFVSKISYSPLLGGYAIVLHDGRAAFLVASNVNFDPNSVTGIWAPHIDDATTVALNHKFKLIAFGRKNSQGIVYSIDELTGGLALMHKLILKTRDYPGCPGAVTCLRWTPDGTALALTWAMGGFSIWSTFGAMIMCSLCWDYGPDVSDPVTQNPLCLSSIDWSAEGYQLWMVNSKNRAVRESDPEFMPFPKEETVSEDDGCKAKHVNPLINKALVLQFVKSPLAVNPGMSKQEHIYLQGEDRLYLNLGQTREFSESIDDDQDVPLDVSNTRGNISLSLMSSGSKHWTTISIPHTYMGNSWPIRFTSLDNDCQYLAVAGRTGLAHYSILQRKWRLFGNETQEKDFIVTGGLLWWKNFIIVGCYNLAALQDEVRIYPREEKLDNSFAKIFKVDAQVLLLNLLNNELVVFCADNQIDIFTLSSNNSTLATNVQCQKTRTVDANMIPGLTFHPACVILVALTPLKTETLRAGNRDSLSRESPTNNSQSASKSEHVSTPSIILNVCGRVIMIQPESRHDRGSGKGRESPQMSLPTVLASCCETIWFPRETNPDKPHLTASLWLYCGDHGMRVWLPVFPREGDHGHTFMSKRIMLHFPLEKLYPLAILFEDAIILGAENDTVLMKTNGISSTNVPYSTLERTSLLFLHPILRQCIRRNLGYHAWEIARTCMMLPYFQHSLELLLHEVLEEEATSTEPIPDALLPSVVEFIQEFPVFHRTIGRCARKTEVALWPHLFAVVGSPRTLFTECLGMKDLETAASYLLILQNLEPPAVAQNHATLLLDAALDTCSWELAKELVRFLRTIVSGFGLTLKLRFDFIEGHFKTVILLVPSRFGSHFGSGYSGLNQMLFVTLKLDDNPEELEEVSQRPIHASGGGHHFGKPPQTPPINKTAAQEEDISLLLGTLQVPRGRSTSITQPGPSKTMITPPKDHKDLARSQSEAAHRLGSHTFGHRLRKASSSSAKDSGQTAEEFFIDIILQRHARKLVSQCRLFDLGTFAAQLDFHMVVWLKKEVNRAARVDNVLYALKKVHSDFSWPYPILLNNVVSDIMRRKQSQESTTSSTPRNSSSATKTGIDENFRALKLDVYHHNNPLGTNNAAISDSGYISHPNNDIGNKDDLNGSYIDHCGLTEQTIHAMLKPNHQFREDMSVLSDVSSVVGNEEHHLNGHREEWPLAHSHYVPSNDITHKGPQKSEIQLRYLLQILMEANCLELATVITIVLKDALALIRIVNAARTSAESKSVVMRLQKSLVCLENWAANECPGYVPFFHAIQPQINSLKSFLNLQSPRRSPKTSTSSLPPIPPNSQHKNNSFLLHRSSSSALNSRKKNTAKLFAKQHSLPSDIRVSEVTNERKQKKPSVNENANIIPKVEEVLDRDEDTRSVSSVETILPEGQDEQNGCILS